MQSHPWHNGTGTREEKEVAGMTSFCLATCQGPVFQHSRSLVLGLDAQPRQGWHPADPVRCRASLVTVKVSLS